MDPDATLAELRKLTATANDRRLTDDEKLQFIDLFEALDDWLSAPRNGFPPAAWDRDRRALRTYR